MVPVGDLAGLTIELDPGPIAGQREFNRELAARCDWAIDTVLDARRPAPGAFVSLAAAIVVVMSSESYLYRVLGDKRLGCLLRGRHTNGMTAKAGPHSHDQYKDWHREAGDSNPGLHSNPTLHDLGLHACLHSRANAQIQPDMSLLSLNWSDSGGLARGWFGSL